MEEILGWSRRYGGVLACVAGFLLGGCAGYLLAAFLPEESRLGLADFVAGYAVALSGGAGAPSFGALLWSSARWPLMVTVLAFTCLGVGMIPLVFGLRGFFLFYCVAGLTRALAGRGVVLALALFGLEGLFTLPALFVLGAQGWEAAKGLRGRLVFRYGTKPPFGTGYWPRWFLCWVAVLFGTALEWALLPSILRAAAPLLAG